MSARDTINEMAQHIIGRGKKPMVISDHRMRYINTAPPEPIGYVAWATAVLSNGEYKRFSAVRPFDEETNRKLQAAAANPDGFLRAEMMAKITHELQYAADHRTGYNQRFLSVLDELKKEAVGKAWRWIDQNEGGVSYVKMRHDKAIECKFPVLPIVKGFRFIRIVRAGVKGIDTLLAFSRRLNPGDSILKLKGSDTTHNGSHYVYYVMLSPEEHMELNRRLIQAERGRFTDALGGEEP